MTINREALVRRHRIVISVPDAQSPLSVGNGEFAFTADITGLQTFPEFHSKGLAFADDIRKGKQVPPDTFSMQLGTQSQWGWHTMPNPEGYRLEDSFSTYRTGRGPVGYPDQYDFTVGPETNVQRGQAAGTWLFSNPQRLDLGRFGLDLRLPGGGQANIDDLESSQQTLDLWTGLLSSSFTFNDEPVRVMTVAHPTLDQIAVRVESPLLASGRLAVKAAFPYASTGRSAADWNSPEKHSTKVSPRANGCLFSRTLDQDSYHCVLQWTPGSEIRAESPHCYVLEGPGTEALEFVVAFAPGPIEQTLPSFDQTRRASSEHWERFWQDGGVVDLSRSSHPSASELERRIVLSQYLTAVNCAGSTPPQETGLVCNSWRGKFHLEMHWWHAAHFALWGRPHLLERSLPWYQTILPAAKATAHRQGYRGARWPKEVGPDGRDAPNGVGPFLVWQQPHPIYYAELLWRAHGDQQTLDRYRELVFATADFMASFPEFDGTRYNLPSPLMPAQESYDVNAVTNPTFELAYWYWGLETAQLWRERLGLERDPEWERVKNDLAVPCPYDGVYPAIATPPNTIRNDHPSMIMALGFVPETPLIDSDVMRKTLHSVMSDWDWPSTWGWDYPVLAMSAARLGEPEVAVDALLMDMPKNTYLPNGHNRQIPSHLPLYLPGNGGLLAAVAMMAAGWEGGPARHAPGFPNDGRWVVESEGLLPFP
jgi:hypothetical protein